MAVDDEAGVGYRLDVLGDDPNHQPHAGAGRIEEHLDLVGEVPAWLLQVLRSMRRGVAGGGDGRRSIPYCFHGINAGPLPGKPLVKPCLHEVRPPATRRSLLEALMPILARRAAVLAVLALAAPACSLSPATQEEP